MKRQRNETNDVKIAPGKVSLDDKHGRPRQRSIGSSGLGCIPPSLPPSLPQTGKVSRPPGAIHHNIGLFVPAFTSITHSPSISPSFPPPSFVLFVLHYVTRTSLRSERRTAMFLFLVRKAGRASDDHPRNCSKKSLPLCFLGQDFSQN